jgi:glucokinase
MDSQSQKKVVLIGDIGGTNSRLSLVKMTDVKTFK